MQASRFCSSSLNSVSAGDCSDSKYRCWDRTIRCRDINFLNVARFGVPHGLIHSVTDSSFHTADNDLTWPCPKACIESIE